MSFHIQASLDFQTGQCENHTPRVRIRVVNAHDVHDVHLSTLKVKYATSERLCCITQTQGLNKAAAKLTQDFAFDRQGKCLSVCFLLLLS